MTKIRIIYHHEEGGWWAISPELPDLVVAGDSAQEVRALVDQGLDGEGYEVEHLAADESLALEAPTSHRFLADLGRVAGPVLMVQGFRFENNRERRGEHLVVPATAHDLTYS